MPIMNLIKMQIPIGIHGVFLSSYVCRRFVSRQWEFAFFVRRLSLSHFFVAHNNKYGRENMKKIFLSFMLLTLAASLFTLAACGFIPNTTDTHQHSFSIYTSNNDATCLNDGTKTAKCDNCTETQTVKDEGSAKGHSAVADKILLPTCTQTGLSEGTHCAECGAVLTEQEIIPELHHSFVEHLFNNDSTCTADGTKTAKCIRCDVTNTIIAADSKTEHKFTNYVFNNDATRTEDGTKTAKCDACDATDTVAAEGTATGYTIGLKYRLNGSYYTVIGMGTADDTELVIPEEFDGIPVSNIGDFAFEDCTQITSVTIPSTLKSISYSAFDGCSALKSVHISDLSAWCKINFAHSYSNPLYYAKNLYLNGELITELVIPDDVTSINSYVFYNCTSLTRITIPSTLKSIGTWAFDGCSELKSVHISDLSAWCKINFAHSYSNPLYYAKNLYLNGELITELVIPDDVTSIGSYAFYNCTSITKITFNGTVAEWKAMSKGYSWDSNLGDYPVHCTDGVVYKA